MTQYKAHSLIQHIQRGWGYLRGEFGEFVEVIPAQQQMGDFWYRGTADSLYQNLQIIKLHHPRHVLVLAGDHIYKMDYGPMLASHVEKRADITVGVVEVPREQATAFGVMSVDADYRITKFSEKPQDPEGIPGPRAVRARLDGHLRLQGEPAVPAAGGGREAARTPRTTSAATSFPRRSTR